LKGSDICRIGSAPEAGFHQLRADEIDNWIRPNGAFARRMWPNRNDVIGQRFRLLQDKENQWLTVIGVVGGFS